MSSETTVPDKSTLPATSPSSPSSSPASPPELYTPSHSLTVNPVIHGPPTIPIKILSTAVPQVITTTKTLRRCCGFALALIGSVFYCLRAVVVLWRIILRLFASGNRQYSPEDYKFLLLESLACSAGIFMFVRIMKTPKLTLKDNNFRNVWMFSLVPLGSFLGRFLLSSSTKVSFILPVIEVIFFTGYIYGLSLNGRSSSLWAGFKPYRYEMVPLILPIPPSSRAFPQYTVPKVQV